MNLIDRWSSIINPGGFGPGPGKPVRQFLWIHWPRWPQGWWPRRPSYCGFCGKQITKRGAPARARLMVGEDGQREGMILCDEHLNIGGRSA